MQWLNWLWRTDESGELPCVRSRYNYYLKMLGGEKFKGNVFMLSATIFLSVMAILISIIFTNYV